MNRFHETIEKERNQQINLKSTNQSDEIGITNVT